MSPLSADAPAVCVVICAFSDDRWDDLLAAHDSLDGQTRPPREIVVVIDHNPGLLRRFAAARPHTTVVENAQQRGLSGARNTGVAAATAPIVLFLDDDAVAAADWVERMRAPFDDPGVVGVGGFATPAWDAPGPPAWFPPDFLWAIGCSYPGLPPGGGEIRNPLGCAMGFRRSAILAVGGFSSHLGRISTTPLGGEETELSMRITEWFPGTRIVHAAEAVIRHRVRAGRQSLRYLLRRCHGEGMSKARIAQLGPRDRRLATERSYVLTVLTSGIARHARRAAAERSFAPLAAAAAMTLAVAAAGVGYAAGMLDAVRVKRTATPSAAMPEPT